MDAMTGLQSETKTAQPATATEPLTQFCLVVRTIDREQQLTSLQFECQQRSEAQSKRNANALVSLKDPNSLYSRRSRKSKRNTEYQESDEESVYSRNWCLARLVGKTRAWFRRFRCHLVHIHQLVFEEVRLSFETGC